MKKSFSLILILFFLLSGCSGIHHSKTVKRVELDKFMKKWYVIAGRFTFLENGAHNAVEEYTFNQKEQRIDIDFYFNRDSFNGPLKRIPQKAWVENKETNATWKVSPFWPVKFDYLIIALADDYSWTAIGVPNQKYLWIMADRWDVSDFELTSILKEVESTGYPVQDIVRLPQRWKDLK